MPRLPVSGFFEDHAMAYSHMFGAEFYYPEGREPRKSKQPPTVADALMSMPKRDWSRMLRECGLHKDADIDDVMILIESTNKVSTLDTSVSVWIDSEGYWTVEVYDSEDTSWDDALREYVANNSKF